MTSAGYNYPYPRPGLTVDCVVFGYDGGELRVMLIQRDLQPFKGCWALPGGFVQMEESLEAAAFRELEEETGLKNLFLEQLYTFGDVARDPRGRVVSVAYYGLIPLQGHPVRAATDAANAAWFPVSDPPQLAFDHQLILETAHTRLKGKVRYQPIGFELLPKKFKLSQLQGLYEAVLEKPLDKRNFRKKILGMGFLRELDEIETDVSHRAARLYQFDKRKYNQRIQEGFNFEL